MHKIDAHPSVKKEKHMYVQEKNNLFIWFSTSAFSSYNSSEFLDCDCWGGDSPIHSPTCYQISEVKVEIPTEFSQWRFLKDVHSSNDRIKIRRPGIWLKASDQILMWFFLRGFHNVSKSLFFNHFTKRWGIFVCATSGNSTLLSLITSYNSRFPFGAPKPHLFCFFFTWIFPLTKIRWSKTQVHNLQNSSNKMLGDMQRCCSLALLP